MQVISWKIMLMLEEIASEFTSKILSVHRQYERGIEMELNSYE